MVGIMTWNFDQILLCYGMHILPSTDNFSDRKSVVFHWAKKFQFPPEKPFYLIWPYVSIVSEWKGLKGSSFSALVISVKESIWWPEKAFKYDLKGEIKNMSIDNPR